MVVNFEEGKGESKLNLIEYINYSYLYMSGEEYQKVPPVP